MITARDILLGVLLPAAVAAMTVLLCALFVRSWRLRSAPVPLGIGLAFAAGFAALMQRVPPVPPLDSVDWLCYAALVTGAVAAIDSMSWESVSNVFALRLLRFAVVLYLSCVLVWLLVRPLLVFNWTGRSGYLWIAAITITMAMIWLALDTLAQRAGGRALAFAMASVAALTALTVMLSGSQKLGQLGGMLTAALFAVAVLGIFFPGVPVARGMVLVYATLHTSLVVTASEHVYASLRTPHAVLLLAAAPLAWLGQLAPARRPRTRAAVQILATALPAAVAAILAAFAFARDATDYSY